MDGVEDFDSVTLDPSTGNIAEFLPSSTFTQLPWDYLHPNHAGYIAMGEVVDIHRSRLIVISYRSVSSRYARPLRAVLMQQSPVVRDHDRGGNVDEKL